MDELEYWLELEGLLARFCHDLDRVVASLTSLDAPEVVRYLETARDCVAHANCVVVASYPPIGHPPHFRT